MSRARVMSGLDALVTGNGPDLRGERLGLILHPASVTSELGFSADVLLDSGLQLEALFGPQHGARG